MTATAGGGPSAAKAHASQHQAGGADQLAAPFETWNVLIIPPVQLPISNVNWATVTATSTALMGGSLSTDTSAQNNEATWNVVLSPGTYDLRFTVTTAASFGIIDVQLDGVSLGTIDLYSVGTTANVQFTLTGKVVANVAGSTKHVLRLLMSTKNASSSAYTGRVSAFNFKRTS